MRRENEHSLHLQHSRGANPGEATGSEHAGETHDPVTTRTCADRSSSPQKSSTLVTATLITATLVTAALEMPETHMNSRVVATPPNPSVTFRFPTPLTGRDAQVFPREWPGTLLRASRPRTWGRSGVDTSAPRLTTPLSHQRRSLHRSEVGRVSSGRLFRKTLQGLLCSRKSFRTGLWPSQGQRPPTLPPTAEQWGNLCSLAVPASPFACQFLPLVSWFSLLEHTC